MEQEAGVKDPAAEGTGEETPTKETVKDNETVPRSVVESVRKDFQEKIDALDEQLQIYKNNASYPQQQQQQPQQTQDPFAGVISDDDVVTGKELKDMMKLMTGRIVAGMNALQFSVKNADYDTLINSVFMKNIKDKRPDLYRAVLAAPQEVQPILAYELAKGDPEYLKSLTKDTQDEEANKAIENAGKPGAVDQVTGRETALSAADKWKSMSSEDFQAHVANVKRQG